MKHVILVVATIVAAVTCQAGTIYVNANGTGDYPTIQDAINNANHGDVIILHPGTYTGNGNRDIDFLGKAITIQSIDPNDPNIVSATIIDCNGTETEPHRGFMFHSGEGSESIVDGITVTGGYISWFGGYSGGGAVSCEGSSPTFTNCIFTKNIAVHAGGSIFNNNSNPSVNKCIFSDNSATYGGGMWNMSNSRAFIANCAFKNNSAIGGGAIWSVSDSCVTITNCTFNNNSASRGSGGAIFCGEVALTTITNCIITGNSGETISSFKVDDFSITNCTIVGNSGNALYCDSGYQKRPSNVKITNCILWDNEKEICNNDDSIIIITYTDIKSGWTGEGNINIDPFFVRQDYWDANGLWVEGDYHLQPNSPCIDTGDPNYESTEGENDLDGNRRVSGQRIDMGAYEYQFNTSPVADAGPDQIAYAWLDGIAEVTLDGSGSYDENGDELTYFWWWTIDGNDYEADGVSPTIELPVGEHLIELVVNDGFEDSEPNQTTVNVIGPIKGFLWITPQMVISRQCPQRRIMATLRLPAGITKDQIDGSEKLTLYPGGIEAVNQFVLPSYAYGVKSSVVFAYFDKDDVLDAIGGNRFVKVYAVGKLKTGQYFYGSSFIRIFNPGHWPRWGGFRQWFDHWNQRYPCVQNKQ